MLYAYVLENKCKLYEVDNSPLFKLIQECKLPESNVYIDDMGNDCRPEFELLKSVAVSGDTVMVRSLLDIADAPDDLINLLKFFGDNSIELASTSEPYYEYGKHFNIIADTVSLCADFTEKKRRLGIERATAEGRMGRKVNADTIDKVKRLKTADFSVQEITKLCGISRSTYYRIIKTG